MGPPAGRPIRTGHRRDLSLGWRTGRVSSLTAEDIRSGYRKTACGSHMIYFRQDGDDIEVIRILHQSMDVGRHL